MKRAKKLCDGGCGRLVDDHPGAKVYHPECAKAIAKEARENYARYMQELVTRTTDRQRIPSLDT